MTSRDQNEERIKSPIYTRTGDHGTSSLYSGERRSKDDLIFEALGAVDELNSHLALAKEYIRACQADHADLITEIQSRLMDLGASIATPRNKASPARKIGMNDS